VIIRTFLAAAAVIAIPVAVVGAQTPAGKDSAYHTKKICDVKTPIGSRLGGVRRCRTRAEIAQARAENRDTVDRIQSQKNLTEAVSLMNMRSICRSRPMGC